MKFKWIAALAAGAACLAGAWLLLADGAEDAAAAAQAEQAIATAPTANPSPFNNFGAARTSAQGSSTAPLSAEGLRTREEKLAMWRSRYERAEQVYNTYRDATRYPHESRPIQDHPDRIKPFDPVVEEKTMRDPQGNPVKGITLKTGQDRVFLSGPDSVKFTVQALDKDGRVLPLTITRASGQTLPDSKQLITPRSANLDFSDGGPSAGVDDIANDGNYSARLTPQTQGFAGASGTIRVLVFVKADGKEGVAHFDVIYTEDMPATWLGGAREAQESGSLNFYLNALVRVPGRYVVSARVDDARGQPFALLAFNEEVAAGAQEFKLNLFGALIRDKRPAFPLKLRDVEAFLLIPDKFPDRLMMPRRAGVVHTSGSYNADSFSPAEWSSEERERYLAEYARDLEQARLELERISAR
jgi:hypothetical protein